MRARLASIQVAQYHRDGCLFPIDALTAEEAGFYLARFEEEERRVWGSSNRTHDDAEGREWLRRPHRRYRWAYDLCLHPAIVAVASDLLGPDVLLWDAKLWPKPATSRSFVSWHQDATYVGLWPLEKVLTIWLALTDSTPENGCVTVLPGTHRRGQIAHHDTHGEANLLSRGQVVDTTIDETQAIPMVLAAGQLSVHHMHLLHGSSGNPSGKKRLGISINYISPDAIETGDDPRPAVVACGQDDFQHFESFTAPSA